jgi:hypothetical protein
MSGSQAFPGVAYQWRSGLLHGGAFSAAGGMASAGGKHDAKPISTAPQVDDQPLLLFCPDQGGWHTGVWFRGKWLAYFDSSIVLEPSHWLPVPADPPDAE